VDDRPMALRSRGAMNQEGGNRFDQEWSEMNKSIRTVGTHRMWLSCAGCGGPFASSADAVFISGADRRR